ncbi:MAG: hypothetical protein JNK60_06140 [Acidobacteria bacterium]|nr:hypothetical protein [Acidobacteriota bacterium]
MAETPEVELLESIETGQAPRRILEFAARGFVPLPPGELVRAIGSILSLQDPELGPLAEETFRGFDPAALQAALASDGVRAEQIDAIARRTTEDKVLEPLIRHRGVSDETLGWLAERIGPALQDILVTNQARLLAAPVIVERLFENPQISTDIRRRADEFLEEFFIKKLRDEPEEDEADAAAQAPAEGEAQQTASWQKTEVDESAEDTASRSLLSRVSTMNVAAKIRLAYRGNKEERMFLIRDRNRLVSTAVLKSPKTREADAEAIANMKNVSEDVLRGISFRKEWMRNYAVMAAIVKNPRAPIDVTLPLVLRLTVRDMKLLTTDKNVPEAVRLSARRELIRRQPS